MQVKWLRAALNNLDEIAAYIALENPQAAAMVVARIMSAVQQLKTLPASGRPGRVLGTRELLVTGLPYLLPYRIRGQQIEILRVFHTSRQPPAHW
ncbi:type II toxin-antitoxin system RelE/ParE family toxin [Pseudomethylobacillus aquaticus]|uniref:Type II toxin-antitoxin system RelE/ParE family toxin n=1 Tax=Pseudomethylobacillus aquaticus TaxID=2676064 RepID=A0A3N0V6Y3_9PROT|nr:type II toxin-antitoxin system RelE/ParE family toxin [Pseudomethylobacillus aquaticus]ROH88371.1 type II toxin-antitoxin system RelE/ParE family toxin [Pseudomethylobacillus aquaticus]